MYLNKNIFIKRGLSLTEMGTKIKDNLKNVFFRNLIRSTFNLFFYPVKRLGMVRSFQMFNEGFTTYRQSFFNHKGGLTTGERIPF